MVVATTGECLKLGIRLQVFLFSFLVPLVGRETFVCVKGPFFYFVDKSFKDTVIVLSLTLLVVKYSVRILFTGPTESWQDVSGTVIRGPPASAIGRPPAVVPLIQHKKPGCQTTIPAMAILILAMKS